MSVKLVSENGVGVVASGVVGRFLYGWVHRLIPSVVLSLLVKKATKPTPDRTHVSTATIIGGAVVFSAFYGLCVFVFHLFFGWRATALYACSLPAASLIAHYYLRELRRFAAGARAAAVLLSAPAAARRLLAWRAELIGLIEAERKDFLAAHASGG